MRKKINSIYVYFFTKLKLSYFDFTKNVDMSCKLLRWFCN